MNRTPRTAPAAAILAALFLALAATPLIAGDLPLTFDVSPRIWGADLGVGYTGLELLDGRDTTLWLWAGGGWEKMNYYRFTDYTFAGSWLDLLTGDVVSTPSITEEDTAYQRAEAKWQVGIEQGLIAGDGGLPDPVVAFLYYRGRYDAHLDPGSMLAATASYDFPDQSEILQNSILLGIAYQAVVKNAHTVKSGLEAEASLEWGPSFLFNTIAGGAEFLRVNATARYFLPLYDAAPDRDRNLFSVYAGDFIALDYVRGGPIPVNVRQTFGGRSPRLGLGGAVRGVDAGSLECEAKLVNNLEVRVLGPALFIPDIVPGFVAYLDVGLFGSPGSPGPEVAGFVASTGAGVFVDLFGFAQLTGYLHYRLVGENANGSALTPFAIDFGLKF